MRCITLVRNPQSARFRSALASRPALWLLILVSCAALFALAAQSYRQSYQLDVYEYQCDAEAFWHGAEGLDALPAAQCDLTREIAGSGLSDQPFHSLPTEYGPLALAVFSVPLLAPPHWYPWLFTLLMVLAVLGTALLLARYGAVGAPYAYLLYVLVGNAVITGLRFDAAPALLTVLALVWARRQREVPAYVALALATLMKIYPLVLVVPFAIAGLQAPQRRTRTVAGLTLFLVITATGMLLPGVLGLTRTASPLAFLMQRGIEFESLPASLLWLAHTVGGVPLSVGYEANVRVVNASIGPLASALGMAIALAVFTIAGWCQWTRRISIGQSCVLVLLALLAGSKVFSPQYLLWVAPFVAYEFGTTKPWLVAWTGVCALTALAFPLAYDGAFAGWHVPDWQAVMVASALRNILLVACCAAAMYHAVRHPHRLASDGAQSTIHTHAGAAR